MPWRNAARGPVRVGTAPGSFLGVPTGPDYLVCRGDDWPRLRAARPEFGRWSVQDLTATEVIAFSPPPRAVRVLMTFAIRWATRLASGVAREPSRLN